MRATLAATLIALLTWGSAVVSSSSTAADSSPSSARTVSPSNEKIAARLTQALGCAGRIWPGWRAEKLHVLVIDVSAKNAILLTGAASNSHSGRIKHEVTSVPYQVVPNQFDQSGPGFAFTSWPNLGRILAVHHSASNEAELDRVIEITVHEGFHLTGQGGFLRPERTPVRSVQRYPEEAFARYIRHEIMISLSRASAGEPLDAVAYWANELVAKRGSGTLRLIDRIEGSAEYVAALGIAIAEHGCTADDSTLAARALAHASLKWHRWLTDPIRPNEVTEAVVIGLYAGLLLQNSQRGGWQKTVQNGQSLLDLAIEGVTPVPQEINNELLGRIEAIVAARNAETRSHVDALNESLRSPHHVVMSIPAVRIGPAVGPQGIFSYVGDQGKNVEIIPKIRAAPLLGSQGGTLALRDTDVRFEADTPCGSARQLVFPVKRESVTRRSDDRVDVAEQGIEGKDIKVVNRDREGVHWLCVAAD